jgi:GNAT superfamily N-acetyltransferase
MIFVADRKDLPLIFDLMMNFTKEINFDYLPALDKEEVLRTLYDNWLKLPIFVHKDPVEGTIDGFVALSFGESWWSKEAFITDYCLYVKPEKRKNGLGTELIQAVRDFCKLNNYLHVTQIFNGTGATEESFEKNGYKTIGFVCSFKGKVA